MGKISRAEFEDFNKRFTAAFNSDDLDGVMAYFAEDALYAEFNGTENRGKKAIREAFEPQFRGDFGPVRFHGEDSFVDEETGKDRNRIMAELKHSGIETRPPFYSLNRQPVYRQTEDPRFPDVTGEYPVSDFISDHGLCLPSGLGLSREQQEIISEKLSAMVS